VDLVVGFGEWVIPALVEKLDAGDLKAQMAAGHALGRISRRHRPADREYAVAADDCIGLHPLRPRKIRSRRSSSPRG
jgi:hypothetical protein